MAAAGPTFTALARRTLVSAGAAVGGIRGEIQAAAVAGAERHWAQILARSVRADLAIAAHVATSAAIIGVAGCGGAEIVAANAAILAFALGV